MGGDSRMWKWLLIVVLVGLAGLLLYPLEDKLKPGIDLAGGTSLIYEIDTMGMSAQEKAGLAERVMNILKARVDPNSQFNLVWRPIGNNRLEIQMPRPPREAQERRAAFDQAREEIRRLNVTKAEVERVVVLPPDQRDKAVNGLTRNVAERAELLAEVVKAWDDYAAKRGGNDYAAESEAQAKYDETVERLVGSSLPIGRLGDVLSLSGGERTTELEKLKKEYPSYTAALDRTDTAHKAWVDKRGSLEDPADLKRLLRGAGVLEFRILARRSSSNFGMLEAPDPALNQPVGTYTEQLQKRGPRAKSGDRYEWYEIDDLQKFTHTDSAEKAELAAANGQEVIEKYAGKWYVLSHVDEGDQRYGLTKRSDKWALRRAYPARDPSSGQPCVHFQLDPRGGLQFASVTRHNLGRQLAIFLDGLGTSHATIQSQIAESGQITGTFTMERVQEIVRKLEAGSLPARLKETPLSERTVGPSLGEMNREMGMRASLYGAIAVVVLIGGYYTITGVVANIALILNILFTLAAMAALEATFTLPGIAGLALTVGMSVDANVLINERMREELLKGVSLRKAVKLGYDRALSTIIDSNLTTLITCVVLGYVGSEDIKGFAMTLGFGLITNMFSAVFVTRLIIETLVEKNIVKRLPMMPVFATPTIAWMKMRGSFWFLSSVLVAGSLGLFGYTVATDREAVFDIELLGGSSVEIELADGVNMDAEDVRSLVSGRGAADGRNAVSWLQNAATALRAAKVEPRPTSGEFSVTADKLSPEEINILLRTTFEPSLAMGGFSAAGNTAVFVTKPGIIPDPQNAEMPREVPVDVEAFRQGLESAAAYAERAAVHMADARVQTVSEAQSSSPAATDEKAPSIFEIIVVEPNKELFQAAILGTMADKLKVERAIKFAVVTDPVRAPTGRFPVLSEHTFLGDVIGAQAPNDVRDYKGGVAFVFDELDPPVSEGTIDARLKAMRLQPQFEQFSWRNFKVFGLHEAGRDADQVPLFDRVAMVVSDEALHYEDDAVSWEERLAKPEQEQAEAALGAEKSLRKVVQFSPQVAAGAQQKAFIALVLSLIGVSAYVWIRFGTMRYGLAAIVALAHGVIVTLGVVTLIDYLGLASMRIDLTMIAAFLTLVGYSINDTIVVFDRIRENRGKLKVLTDKLVEDSLNATLSRTVLTGGTTLMVMCFLLFMGGPGVMAFSFVMLVGVVIGTYSSIAIASPLLQAPRVLHGVTYVLIGMVIIGLGVSVRADLSVLIVSSVLALAFVIVAFTVERRMAQAGRAAAA